MAVLEVLETAIRWHTQGYRSALITVLKTYGGSPRPPGSMAVIREDGVIAGSVSGGCVEMDLADEIRQYETWDSQPKFRKRIFGKDAVERDRYRLPCNNTIELAVENHWSLAELQQICTAIRSGETLARVLNLKDGATTLQKGDGTAGFIGAEDLCIVPCGPRWQAMIIGATDITSHLVPLLISLDYSVRICEPRDEYANAWMHPMVQLERCMPDDWLRECSLHSASAVIAISHDLKYDDLALLEALRSPAFYVGAIGSVHTSNKRRERLQKFGLSERDTRKLVGPVGLDIGSKTPAEIAVAIAADLIRTVRRSQQTDRSRTALLAAQ